MDHEGEQCATGVEVSRATPVNYCFGVCVCGVCSPVSHISLVLLADHVFGLEETTSELFEVIGKPIVDGVINGVNGVCVCVCMHWQQWSGHNSYSISGV